MNVHVSGDISGTAGGSSKLSAHVTGGKATFKLSGSSQLELQGTGKTLDITASGSSVAELPEFAVQDAQVNADGGSTISLSVSGNLIGKASGGSHVTYAGQPKSVNVQSSGGSSIKPQ